MESIHENYHRQFPLHLNKYVCKIDKCEGHFITKGVQSIRTGEFA